MFKCTCCSYLQIVEIDIQVKYETYVFPQFVLLGAGLGFFGLILWHIEIQNIVIMLYHNRLMITITNMEKQNSTKLTDFWQQINGSHLKISYEIAAHP